MAREEAPHSLATGILDDETYDGLAVLLHPRRQGVVATAARVGVLYTGVQRRAV